MGRPKTFATEAELASETDQQGPGPRGRHTSKQGPRASLTGGRSRPAWCRGQRRQGEHGSASTARARAREDAPKRTREDAAIYWRRGEPKGHLNRRR